jgi:hypothetical protein
LGLLHILLKRMLALTGRDRLKLDFIGGVLFIDDATARGLVDDFVDSNVVTPVPEDHVLVHEPSGAAFDSPTQIAVFHRGWRAARDVLDARPRRASHRDALSGRG